MEFFRNCLRWTYRFFWYSLVGLILSIAVVISILRVFPPDVEVYRERVEQLASTVIETSVRIGSMDARIAGFTPQVIFNDVILLDAKGEQEIVRFEKASLGIDLLRSILSKKLIPDSFTIHGVNLSIIRQQDGTFIIRGLDFAKVGQQLETTQELTKPASNELSRWLFERSELAIKDSSVVWIDEIQGKKTRHFQHVNFFIRNDEQRHQLTGTVQLPDELGRDVKVDIDFTGNILDPLKWQGRFYASGKGLQIVNWGMKPVHEDTSINAGVIDAELWGVWKDGHIETVTADVAGYDMDIRFHKDTFPFYVRLASGQFHWRREGGGWLLNIDDFRYHDSKRDWPASDISVRYQVASENTESVKIYSSFIRIGNIRRILLESRLMEKDIQETLAGLNPAGDLANLHFGYTKRKNQQAQYYLSTGFKDLTIEPWKKIPGFTSIDGQVQLNHETGQLQLENSVASVELPKLFRQPFEITKLDGKLRWWRYNEAWHIQSDNIYLSTTDIDSDLALALTIPDNDTSPYLDMQVRYVNGDARQAWRYYPVSIMDKELVDWLDNGIVDGHVTSGGFVFNGRFKDFPFRNGKGTMIAHLDTREVELNYQKGWPHINGIASDIHITGLGLEIYATSGKVYDSWINNTSVRIDQFREPVLKVRSDINGSTHDLIRYVVNTPIAVGGKKFYDKNVIKGKTTGKIQNNLPLAKRLKKTVANYYDGEFLIKDSSLSSWNDKLQISGIAGKLNFNPRGVFSNALTGKVFGEATSFKLFTSDVNGSWDIKLSMQGTVDAETVGKQFDAGFSGHLKGKTPWQGALSFGYKTEKKTVPGAFQFASSLKGVLIDLPAPLSKTGQESFDVRAEIMFPENDMLPVTFSYGDRMAGNLLFNTDENKPALLERGAVMFSGKEAVLPVEKQFVLRGSLTAFPLGEWQAFSEKQTKTPGTAFLDTLGVPVVFDMQELNIKTTEGDEQYPDTDPRETALINGQVDDFSIDDMPLGKVVIQTTRHPEGVKINTLKIQSAAMQVDIEGSWLYRNGRQRTNLLINARSNNLGAMLQRLGYAAMIKKGKARAVMQANWSDAPYHFKMAKLNGTLGIVIDDGEITNIEPGAGRMLGLFSVAELPRRLFLDFGELREGFEFKQIYGLFEIEDGNAWTKNLSIISSIAFIGITGRTGLAQQDFDQHISVVPNVTGSLPAISWILGGGQIGAVTLILDQLIGGEVNKSAATKYHVTGSWEKPVITKLPSTQTTE